MTPRVNARQFGFTMVELLIASTIMIVVLAIAGVFLAQQSQLQKATQNRSELQDRVRVGMQLVTQDLALAGNSAVMGLNGAKLDITWPGCFDGAAGCVRVSDAGATLEVRYLSSQFASGSECRDITYRLLGTGVFERSDVGCGATATYVPLADNMVDFTTTVHCSNGTDLTAFPSGSCPPLSSYGRSVTVDLMGQSRSPGSGDTAAGCATGYVCYAMTQETLMPNMKDQ
jgi:type II secretory pathway pseudopilin PulG